MTAIQFGTGWAPAGRRPFQGRPRTLLWLSDVGWALFDDGYNVDLIRRGLYDEIAVRCRLLGWEDHVDQPSGAEWAIDRIVSGSPGWAPNIPKQDCPVCWGEGWSAGPHGVAVRCSCSDIP